MTHALNWFEIPVRNIDRATDFYSAILDSRLKRMAFNGTPRTFLPYGEGGIGGALIPGADRTPSRDGSLIYLNGGTDLSEILDRVEEAGGTIDTPKTHFSKEVGYIAVFLDSEGNRVGLHSPQ